MEVQAVADELMGSTRRPQRGEKEIRAGLKKKGGGEAERNEKES